MIDSGENPQIKILNKVYPTQATVVFLAITLVVLWMMPVIGQAWKQNLRIGILAPTTGPDKTLGKQVEIGTKLGIQAVKMQLGNASIITTTDWNGKDTASGLAQLRLKKVDVVIGGATPAATREFYKLSEQHSIPPTILLTNSENTGGKNQRILHMGISPEVYYKGNLLFWTKKLNLKKIGVIYDQSNKNTLHYGKDLTWKALSSAAVKLEMVPFDAMQTQGYISQVKKLAKYKPDAIILAGRSWDVKNLVFGMSGSLNVPIFLARPLSARVIKKFASVTPKSIYYSTQLPLFTNPKVRPFTDEVNKQLGWHGQVFSQIAMKAYDAEQVLATAWKAWSARGEISSSKPWEKIIGTKVQGLADILSIKKFNDSNTVTATEYLYEFTAVDKVKKWRLQGDVVEEVKN